MIKTKNKLFKNNITIFKPKTFPLKSINRFVSNKIIKAYAVLPNPKKTDKDIYNYAILQDLLMFLSFFYKDGKIRVNFLIPTKENNNPTNRQKYYPLLKQDILDYKPDIIFIIGKENAQFFFKKPNLTNLTGHFFPYKDFHNYIIPIDDYYQKTYEYDRIKGIENEKKWFSHYLNNVLLTLNTLKYELNIKDNIDIIKIQNNNTIDILLDKLSKYDRLAIDIETTGLYPYKNINHKQDKIITIGIAINENKCIIIDYQKIKNVFKEKFSKFLNNYTGKIIMHNSAFELRWFSYEFNIDINKIDKWTNKIEDTMLIAYLLDNRGDFISLKTLAYRYFGDKDYALKEISNNEIEKVEFDKLALYNAKDCVYTYMLYDMLFKQLDEKEKKVYNYILKPATICYTYQTHKGVYVNDTFINKIEPILTKELNKIKEEIYNHKDIKRYIELKQQEFYKKYPQYINKKIPKILQKEFEFNFQSNKQLIDYFINYKEYKVIKRSKLTKEPAVNIEVIKYYADKYNDFLAKQLIKYREIMKLNKTYIKGVIKDIFIDNNTYKFHPNVNLVFTQSGRTSCNSPNLQNFPKRKHKWLRNIIKAPDNYYILKYDLGQIEFRVAGFLAQDKEFLKIIREGFDIHLYYSKLIFGEKLAKEKRSLVKNGFVFPTLYKASPKKIAELLEISEKKAKTIQEHFYNKFPNVKFWQNKTLNFYKTNKYVESPLGRKRFGVLSPNIVVNHSIQSLASDILVLSFIELTKLGYYVFMTIHDELDIYIKKENLQKAIKEVEFIMTKKVKDLLKKIWNIDFNVPLTADWEIGKYFGNTFDKDDIKNMKKNELKLAFEIDYDKIINEII